jgi:hypothetical protein
MAFEFDTLNDRRVARRPQRNACGCYVSPGSPDPATRPPRAGDTVTVTQLDRFGAQREIRSFVKDDAVARVTRHITATPST